MSLQASPVFSLDSAANDTSVTLDLLRYLGAQAVCIGHAIAFFGVADRFQPPNMPYMQNLGVMVFFVLSGFVIAHALMRGLARPNYRLDTFIIERIARIYSAYLPALMLIAILDITLLKLGRFEYPSYLGWQNFIGNLLMMQNYPGPFKELLAVPSFGSAGQLWSLAVEFHIYLFVGATFFFALGRGWPWALPVMLLAAAVPFYSFSEQAYGVPGAGLFILWLLGFSAYFIAYSGVGRHLPLTLLVLGSFAMSAYWINQTVPAREYRIELYLLLALAFLLLVVATQRIRLLSISSRLRDGIRFAANYSFSLYLIHYSLIYFFKAFWTGKPWQGALMGIILSNAIAIPFAYYTEFRHRDFSSWIGKLLARLCSGSNSARSYE